ncbi:MAG: indole-3-glycerol phosphate synthase TrpC [Bacteroidetes bacterium]|nr:indole-3-glycerol phosphate synthase TrpC [Bacteroidota bacterium]
MKSVATILDKIIAHKKKEVEERKSLIAVNELEKSDYFSSPCISLKKSLLDNSKSGIIAEFKRKSPSKGIINDKVSVEEISIGYQNAGATALSILTDKEFFGGTTEDIFSVRKQIQIPILRKEFIVDEYQIIEAKSIGADVVLLLANILSANEIKQFATTAKFLDMEVLLEIRDEKELDSVNVLIDCIGVNNRNLKDFKVNVQQSFQLAEKIPKGFVKISESGIDLSKTIQELKKVGYKGFLIGETFMKQINPAQVCKDFISSL